MDDDGGMDDPPPRIPTHEAVDRFGKASLRTVHELTVALAANDDADEEPVVRRTGGSHRSIDGLAALLDAALAEEDEGPGGPPADAGGSTGAAPRRGA